MPLNEVWEYLTSLDLGELEGGVYKAYILEGQIGMPLGMEME